MFWIFLLGIIWLAVLHTGFRKAFFWATGVTVVCLLFLIAVLSSGPSH